VTAAALARELQVSERTIYRDLSELAAQGAPVQGEAGVGYMLRPGLFLPPLMLTEDETEAVLLGLRYVDQRGDDVLTKAAANAHAKILAVLPQEGQIAATLPMAIPGPKASGFPDNKVPLNTLRLAIERLGGWRSATSMLKGVRLGVSFGLFNSASWTAHGS
jgi:predicted DNA-binding transcriptional regulator YafY